MSREPKLQRWTDLIAALLRRHYAATFEELARDVPAYADPSRKKDAIMRMFERDKDELRSFGIAIDTVPFDDEGIESSGYRLDRKAFYLPYLSLAATGGKPASKPRKPKRFGYQALASLVFEPDELTIIAQAAQRIRALGDPVLGDDADSAIRKLSFDLPIPDSATLESPQRTYVAERIPEAPHDVFAVLNDALTRRKRITFEYHTMSSDSTGTRTVEPYGLFFLSSHWYLAARDVDKNQMRNFRLSRMHNVVVNTAKAQTADHDIPESFNLRKHAQSKKPWELGEGDANEAIVEFSGATGASKAAARLGVSVHGARDRRKFRINRLDAFARWLLSFGGEAIPVSPSQLVDEFSRQARETSEMYGEGNA
jgi:predicted DNA-binding transcriptional regulator YafY